MSDAVRPHGRRSRHRRRHKVPRNPAGFHWWHVALAVVVGAAGVWLAIQMLSRGAVAPPELAP